ncbi:MAG: UDP-N-acetylmuramoyl-tripeptide--D-alanyl-D-alanine ligase [Rugosibacter sp.]|uniref:UDP-N-acetylmuramoyl-tripeptide--D-alanyl-D- alanine ligase n=1 Tax=Rugosibacter aromaticivorans TaxID=1565605 RepID=UPI000ADFE96B|nr:UDP-N-acetylmuramoyl-tripeptide--D-alanyl-D-alanine ligase [Rugosibacter aromaticivorans]TAJ18090.1 MAG: UDP-N-acetylmuramoyl-tripeptide--D-alanyl-D-alanine ligase [Rugosibacter sp.]TBR12818.1 MAG: UDP-N-acetylmuramoyl-tripeptide--D-alanyl-D-alanine ligase [Rugosibacter sp.]
MMTLLSAAQAIGAQMQGADRTFTAVTSDSRAIVAGDLFVAIKGDHFDGHSFVSQAITQGAAGALVSQEFAAAHPGLPLIAVADTRRALGALAAAWRARFTLPLIGVTGSNGKTTVKEMCAAILRIHDGEADGEGAKGGKVLATEGNLNNDIGLPLTLLKLRDTHTSAVMEMGMSHAGEINYLTHLAAPTVAVVINAQRAHLAGLGTVQDVGLAKGEIFAGLGAEGIAVFNADDAQAELWHTLAQNTLQLTFGMRQVADVRGEFTPHGLGGTLRLSTPWGVTDIPLGVPGQHNAMNACAAAAATLAIGVTLEMVTQGLAGFRGVKGRLQQCAGQRGALIMDDTYNANPDSMRAAIDVLAGIPGRRIFVMGDMGEAGEAAAQFHDEVGGYAKSHGIDRLLCLGELAEAAAHNFGEGGEHFAHLEALIKTLRTELDAHTTVLVKGSRFMRMERVVKAIIVEPGVEPVVEPLRSSQDSAQAENKK